MTLEELSQQHSRGNPGLRERLMDILNHEFRCERGTCDALITFGTYKEHRDVCRFWRCDHCDAFTTGEHLRLHGLSVCLAREITNVSEMTYGLDMTVEELRVSVVNLGTTFKTLASLNALPAMLPRQVPEVFIEVLDDTDDETD